MYDVIIIGGGPAGLSAAVYAKRAMLDVLVIEKEAQGGGQIVQTGQVDNYLGMEGMSGYAMAVRFQEHAKALGVPFRKGTVEAVRDGKTKTVVLSDGTVFEAIAVIIAAGAKHRRLGAEGEEAFVGSGVSYCATCDAVFYRGKDVAVAGGGNVALSDALHLAKGCRKVYLLHRRDVFRAERYWQERVKNTANIEFLPFCEIKRIGGDRMVEHVTILHNRTGKLQQLAVSAVFVAVGMEPVTAFVKGAAALDGKGYIVAAEDCRTDVDGIFAAGDVRTKENRQIVTAVADGANAALAAGRYIDGMNSR